MIGVEQWLGFLLALTESLISDERTNEVKDPSMTPRAYCLTRGGFSVDCSIVAVQNLTHFISAKARRLAWASRCCSTPVGLLP